MENMSDHGVSVLESVRASECWPNALPTELQGQVGSSMGYFKTEPSSSIST